MAFYEKGHVRIHYQEVGSGFPLLAPKSEISLFPWEPKDRIPVAARHVRTFLRAHRPN